MRLKIDHTTTFTYDQKVSEAYTELRLRPVERGGQRCLSFALTTEPDDRPVLQYRDRFGNDVRHFDVLEPHERLVVTASSEVLTPATPPIESEELSPLDRYDYLTPTAYAPHSDAVRAFAARGGDSADPDLAMRLMHEVFASLKYETGATDVKSTAEDVLRLERGVCQDFAHLMLAACRIHGLPARYVSGYLYDPKQEGGETASHAWVDVYTGWGWQSFDPTHDRPQTEAYVRLGVGRDYADVPPTRGVFKGDAKETLGVRVTISALSK
jgi:transglutaminase-like putative cysteine protease